MKICKIRFKNIHSLKGEHSIDFVNGVLGESGLFVITGATGTGKSTILDVITLALYNRIPRIDKQITETVIEDEGVILTRNAMDCYAEVEYEVKGKKFRSSWSIKRKRTGKLEQRKQELSEIPGNKILVSGLSDVVNENERIIGLNYNQFVQSLILAQGQFSKLLLAKKDERNIILEKITGSAIYREIGKQVYKRFKEAEETVKTQKIKMGEVILLSNEELTVIHDEISQKSPLLLSGKKKKKDLENRKILKENILRNTKKREEIQIEWDAFIEQKKEASVLVQQLSVHDSLVGFKEQMLSVEQAGRTLSELSEKIEKGRQDEKGLLFKKAKIIESAAALVGEKLEEDKLLISLEAFRIQVSSLVEAEKEKFNQVRQEAQRIKDKIQELKPYGINLQDGENLPAEILREISHIDAEIKRIGITAIQEVHKRKGELSELILSANKIIGERKLFDEKNNGVDALKIKLADNEKEIAGLILEENQKQKELETLHPDVEISRIALEEWKQRKSLDQLRSELVEGKPCPLCGSESHPYTTGVEAKLINALQEKFDDLTRKHDDLKSSILKLKTKKESLANSNSKDKDDLIQRLTALSELEKTLTDLCLVLKWNRENIITEWENELILFQQKKNDLDALEKSLQAKDILLGLQKLHNSQKTFISIHDKAKAVLNDIYKGTDITIDVSNLKQNFIELDSKIMQLKKQLTELQDNLIKTQNSKDELELILLPELKKHGIDSLDILKSKLLTESAARQIRQSIQLLKDKEVSIQTSIKEIDKALKEDAKSDDATISLAELLESLDTLTNELNNLEKRIWDLDNKISIDNQNRVRQAANQLILVTLLKDLDLWSTMNMLIGDGQGKKFSSFVQDLTLRKLIEYGNKRLSGFSDRYLLHVDNESDALKVMDMYMGDTLRSVSSLSGGETFKLSLALAFGLSDLAAKNVEIESLFIDEGFGSLDAESLDQAINILENMQNESNKSIGIISHVGELKDRIAAKINLVRSGAGYSTIEIE